MSNGEKYLITGGNGFIGSHLVNKLIKRGKNIHVVVKNKKYNWRFDNVDKIEIKYLDITDYSELKKYVDKIKPDYILHLAGYVNTSRTLESYEKLMDVNFKGTYNLLKALNNIDYKIFINTGSSDEYGNLESPIKENYKEDPVSPYSLSKTCSSYLCKMFKNMFNRRIVSVRPFLVYGPKQISNMLIPDLIRHGLSKIELNLTRGSQTKDFIFVEDLVHAYLKILENYQKINKYEIFNIGSGYQILIKDVVEIVGTYFPDDKFKLGGKAYRKNEPMEFFSDIQKIKKLGWVPEESIETGISKTVMWWKNNYKRIF